MRVPFPAARITAIIDGGMYISWLKKAKGHNRFNVEEKDRFDKYHLSLNRKTTVVQSGI
jgi:hypothetical protein